jgi:uncharacterized protein YkwD
VFIVLAIAAAAGPLLGPARSDDRDSAYVHAGCGNVRQHTENLSVAALEEMTLCLVNYERARHDLAPLARNSLLDFASRAHSADIVERQFWSHVNPDGIDPGARMAFAGYDVTTHATGENIVYGRRKDLAFMVDGWMRSPGHRRNILSRSFHEIGVGVARGAPDRRGDKGSAVTITTDFGG